MFSASAQAGLCQQLEHSVLEQGTSPIRRSHSPKLPRRLSQIRRTTHRGHRRNLSLRYRSRCQRQFLTLTQVPETACDSSAGPAHTMPSQLAGRNAMLSLEAQAEPSGVHKKLSSIRLAGKKQHLAAWRRSTPRPSDNATRWLRAASSPSTSTCAGRTSGLAITAVVTQRCRNTKHCSC